MYAGSVKLSRLIGKPRQVEVRELDSGKTYREPYDSLVLSMGAAPIRPGPLLEKVGHDHPRVLCLRNLTDVDRIKEIVDQGVRSAVVVGGGFIGLEVAEQLVRRKVQTSLVELLPQVMPPMDAEMAQPVHQTLVDHGVDLYLGDEVADLERCESRVQVSLGSGKQFPVDLARAGSGSAAGIGFGSPGRPGVDQTGRDSGRWQPTDQRSQYLCGGRCRGGEGGGFRWYRFRAVGGAGEPARTFGGGPDCCRRRIGRVSGREVRLSWQPRHVDRPRFRPDSRDDRNQRKGNDAIEEAPRNRITTWFRLTPTATQATIPGATPMAIKLLYEKPSGRVLGAQAIGPQGIDKRIDVLAMAIQMGATVYDLEQAELCYAPPFGSAKDPVNMLGFMAANALRRPNGPGSRR